MRRSTFWFSLCVSMFLCPLSGYAIQGDLTGAPKSPAAKPGASGKTAKPKRPPAARDAGAKEAAAAAAGITVAAEPGSTVLVNKQPRGTTDARGRLLLKGFKPGQYQLVVRKQHYRDEARQVGLAAGESRTESFALVPLPVAVNIAPNVDGVKIDIKGAGEYDGRVSGLQLPPKDYQVTLTKPGYRTVARSITLKPGQPLSLPVAMERMTVDEMLASGNEFLSQRDYPRAIAAFDILLATQPDHPAAQRLLGWSYYATGNYPKSSEYFARAISLDEKIAFPVRHRHNQQGETCAGTITLGKSTFAFKSAEVPAHDFEVAYEKFKEFSVDAGAGNGFRSKVRIPRRDGRRGEDERDQSFYAPEIVSPTSAVACPDCKLRMEVINQLVALRRKQPPATR